MADFEHLQKMRIVIKIEFLHYFFILLQFLEAKLSFASCSSVILHMDTPFCTSNKGLLSFFKNFYQLQVHDRYAWRAIFNGECLFLIRENFSPNFFSRSGKVSKSEMMRVLLKLDRIEENEDDEVSTDEDDDDTVDGGSASKHRAVCSSDLNHYRHTCSFLTI